MVTIGRVSRAPSRWVARHLPSRESAYARSGQASSSVIVATAAYRPRAEVEASTGRASRSARSIAMFDRAAGKSASPSCRTVRLRVSGGAAGAGSRSQRTR